MSTRTDNVENIAGFDVYNAGAASCIDEILAAAKFNAPGSGRPNSAWLACMNPHSYVETTRDRKYAVALNSADWLIPDGAGIVLASVINNGQIRERVTGSDIFSGIMAALNQAGGGRAFFLGSTEETLRRIQERARRDYPDVSVSVLSPPFKAEFDEADIDSMVEQINSSQPDVLWVGLTAPKQEKLIHEIIDRANVRFAAAVGAVFDFYAGTVKRSHPAFRQIGLEWLPRLLAEPRRLWRRTFVSAPIFLWRIVLQKFGRSGTADYPKNEPL